jgi:hypothetical protein
MMARYDPRGGHWYWETISACLARDVAAIPTGTPGLSATPTPSLSPTPTRTATPTVTLTPTSTVTSSSSPTATATPDTCALVETCETPTPQMTPENAVVRVVNGAPAGADGRLTYNPINNTLTFGSNPGQRPIFDMFGDGNNPAWFVTSYENNTDGIGFEFYRARGSAAVPLPLQPGDAVLDWSFFGFRADSGGFNEGAVLLLEVSQTPRPTPVGTSVPMDWRFFNTHPFFGGFELLRLYFTGEIAMPQIQNCDVHTDGDGLIVCPSPTPTPTASPTPTGNTATPTPTATATATFTIPFATPTTEGTPLPVGHRTEEAGNVGRHGHPVDVPFCVNGCSPIPTNSAAPAVTPTPVLNVNGTMNLQHRFDGNAWTLLTLQGTNANDTGAVPANAFMKADFAWTHTGATGGLGATIGRSETFGITLNGSGAGRLLVSSLGASIVRNNTGFPDITLFNFQPGYTDNATVSGDSVTSFHVRALALNGGNLSGARGFWIEPPDTSFGGTVTSFEGLRIGTGALLISSSSAGILQEDTTYLNILGGKTNIGNAIVPGADHAQVSLNNALGPSTQTAGQALSLSHWFTRRGPADASPTPTSTATPTPTTTQTAAALTATPTPTATSTPVGIVAGDVVVQNTGAASSVSLTSIAEDPNVIGVAQTTGTILRVATTGIVNTRCNGTVQIGDAVVSSSTARECRAASGTVQEGAVFGIALSARQASSAPGNIPVLLTPRGTNARTSRAHSFSPWGIGTLAGQSLGTLSIDTTNVQYCAGYIPTYTVSGVGKIAFNVVTLNNGGSCTISLYNVGANGERIAISGTAAAVAGVNQSTFNPAINLVAGREYEACLCCTKAGATGIQINVASNASAALENNYVLHTGRATNACTGTAVPPTTLGAVPIAAATPGPVLHFSAE